MTILIYFTILTLNIISSVRKTKTKWIVILSLIVILLLMGGAGPNYNLSTNSLDYYNYQRSYESIRYEFSFSSQIGYYLLERIGGQLGLDFFMFRLIILAVCIWLIYKFVIVKYSFNVHYVISLYMLYPMIIDSEQLRNFIAMTILLLAIPLVIDNDKKKNTIMFICLIFLASSFHIAFIMYGILIFVNSKNKNTLVKIIAYLTLFLTILTILNNNQIPLLESILGLIEENRISLYLSSTTNTGYLIPFVLHFISVGMLFVNRKIFEARSFELEKIGETEVTQKVNFSDSRKFINTVMWINVIAISFFPLFIMNLQFLRMIRNLLLLNFIVYSNVNKILIRNRISTVILNISAIISIVLWFIMDLTILVPNEMLLTPFFNNNYFFN